MKIKSGIFVVVCLLLVQSVASARSYSNGGVEYKKETLVFASEAEKRDIQGYWLDINDAGRVSARIHIYKKGNKYYGKSVEIVDIANRLRKCLDCTDDRKGKVSLNLEIIRDLQKVKNDWDWKKGTILDPSSGDIYKMRAWTSEDGSKLNMRGYLGPFFQTRIWLRTQKSLGEEYGKITPADEAAYAKLMKQAK